MRASCLQPFGPTPCKSAVSVSSKKPPLNSTFNRLTTGTLRCPNLYYPRRLNFSLGWFTETMTLGVHSSKYYPQMAHQRRAILECLKNYIQSTWAPLLLWLRLFLLLLFLLLTGFQQRLQVIHPERNSTSLTQQSGTPRVRPHNCAVNICWRYQRLASVNISAGLKNLVVEDL